jgi:heme/copper-type cytochrome/quinol oxidase subunit 3
MAAGGDGSEGVAGGPILAGGNGVLGMVIFLAAEVMLFAGLISAFLILRSADDLWPPPGQPRLPVAASFANTLVLIASGATMLWATGAGGRRRRRVSLCWLGATAALGGLFLAVQGVEWMRLLRFGVHASSSTYAGAFYTLIASHALHVVAALAALVTVAIRLALGRARAAELEVVQLYWLFVVAVWPLLYAVVYLT